MDYNTFLTNLPTLYTNWYSENVQPKSQRFQPIVERVASLTRVHNLQLLNAAVDQLDPGEIYCEVGTYRGATLIGALLDHRDVVAVAIDNFSEFDQSGDGLTILNENLDAFDMRRQVHFFNDDFERVLLDPERPTQLQRPIGVYLYDGAHDYRAQLMGLLLIRPFLAERAIIVIDDANWQTVTQANRDFVTIEPRCKSELRLSTPCNGHEAFWNGVEVLSWDERRGAAASSRIKRTGGKRRMGWARGG